MDTKLSKMNLKQLHVACGWHRKAVEQSKVVGCFHCESIYKPIDIVEWIEEPEDCPRGSGWTAICPKCDVDAVLPDNIDRPITPELLREMKAEWF